MDDKLEADELSLELDIDEAEHLQSIHEKYIDLLRLANDGAVLSGEISAEACKGLLVTNQVMILAMLILKIVEQVRTAIRGILCGHYSAVPVLLRSALDSISVLHLVSNNERQFRIWILLSYIDQEQLKVDDRAAKKLRKVFVSKARVSYDSLISDDPHLRPVTGLINEFNAHVHPDVFGIFERAGVQASLEEILGYSIRQAIAISEGDPVKALKIVDLKEKHQIISKVPQSGDTETVIFGPGLIEERLLDHYSQVAHAATHHLFDIVEHLFVEYVSNSTRKKGLAWHKASMKEFDIQLGRQKC